MPSHCAMAAAGNWHFLPNHAECLPNLSELPGVAAATATATAAATATATATSTATATATATALLLLVALLEVSSAMPRDKGLKQKPARQGFVTEGGGPATTRGIDPSPYVIYVDISTYPNTLL